MSSGSIIAISLAIAEPVWKPSRVISPESSPESFKDFMTSITLNA